MIIQQSYDNPPNQPRYLRPGRRLWVFITPRWAVLAKPGNSTSDVPCCPFTRTDSMVSLS